MGSIPGWGIKIPHDLEQLSLPTTAREPVIPSAATKTQHSQIKKKKFAVSEILYSFKMITNSKCERTVCGGNKTDLRLVAWLLGFQSVASAAENVGDGQVGRKAGGSNAQREFCLDLRAEHHKDDH